MNLELGKVCRARKFIFVVSLLMVVSCLCSILNVNAKASELQNNGFVLEDNMLCQNVGSQVKIKANSTSNPSGTYYRFIAVGCENWDMDIISDSQSTEAVWVPKEFGFYDLYMDVYTPGDNSSKITHTLRVYALEDRSNLNNPLNSSKLVDSGFTPEIVTVKPEPARKISTVSKYVGIKNDGGTCSLESALQLLYHDQQFKDLILGLEGLNAKQTPYLSALKEQFIQMDSTTGTNVDLTFTKEQQGFLIAGDGEFLADFDGVEWAEIRLLNKCVEECTGSERNAAAEEIKEILCFDKYDVVLFGEGSENKLFSAMVIAERRDVLGESIKNKMGTCRRLPETVNLVCINESMGYYGFNDVIENAARIELTDGRVFELQGVVMHPGGHYYALVKNSESGNWVRLDDTNVVPVTGDVSTEGQAVQLTYREVK